MADIEPTDDETVVTPAAGQGESAPKGGEGKTFTQADVDRLVGAARISERGKYTDYDKFKADATELAAIREGEKTELQKALDRAAEAESRAETAEFARLRDKIANRKDKVVPVEALTGKTEAELIACADALLAWRGETPTIDPTPKPKPKPKADQLKSGASGDEQVPTDPKELAAYRLRQMRRGE